MVIGRLRRASEAVVEGLHVENILVYECPKCSRTLGTPQISSGRLFAAAQERFPARVREFRVPAEAADVAFSVHAALGSTPAGDEYALPIWLGLRVVGHVDGPREEWRSLEGFRATERARPKLNDFCYRRITALVTHWSARSRAEVVRILLLAALQAAENGFSGVRAVEDGNQVRLTTETTAIAPIQIAVA